MSLKSFTDAYVTVALWSSTDNTDESGGEPLDKNYGPEDLSRETRETMEADCADFYAKNKPVWSGQMLKRGDEDEQAGHDFWFTRNGHGVGFWETDDWEEAAGEKLTAAAKRFGSFYLDVYNGKVHGTPLRRTGSTKRGSRRPKKNKRTSRRAR